MGLVGEPGVAGSKAQFPNFSVMLKYLALYFNQMNVHFIICMCRHNCTACMVTPGNDRAESKIVMYYYFNKFHFDLMEKLTNGASVTPPRPVQSSSFRTVIPRTLTLIPAWLSNYIHCKVWGEITYLFPNFNGFTVEVWEWISNFVPHFTGNAITYSCWD